MRRSGRGHVRGPLAAYAEGFREVLLGRGYTWGSAARQIHLMAHVSRWLDANGVGPDQLTPAAVARFVEARRAEGYVGLLSVEAVTPLIDYLRDLGVVAPQPPVFAASGAERLIADYAEYLVAERGLAAASLRSYVGVARRFLDDVSVGGELDLEGMGAVAVTQFVQRECGRLGAASAKVTVKGVRSLLRFLYLDGRVGVLLSAAVPAAAGWRLAALPRPITATELTRLLESSNRRSVDGRRDFAILAVLARLGLRAGEVAALRLDDVDWRQGEIVVRGKGRRREPMPMPVDVGQALIDWLCRGRRADTGGGAVFTSLRAPYRPLSVGGVSAVVRRACRRAGITPVGAHRLRHTAATGLLRAGAGLPEVGQLLRHRRLATTAVYAKVDVAALSTVAQPWPQELS